MAATLAADAGGARREGLVAQMGHVEHRAAVGVPLEFAFGYVDDYRNVPRWMFGIKHFTPIGEQISGVGAVFDTALNLGPMTLHLRGEIIEWEQSARISLRAVKGIEGTIHWSFAAVDPDSTEIGAVCDWKVPGGLAGRALDRVIHAFAGPAVRHTEKSLRHHLVTAYAESPDRRG